MPGATTARWIGPLLVEARPTELGRGTGFDHELLLRVDYVPGAEPATTGRLSGRLGPARAGRPGARLANGRGLGRAAAGGAWSGCGTRIAVDLFAGDRRLARMPRGRGPIRRGSCCWITAAYGNPILRWRNPDGRTLDYEYAVSARTLEARR